MVHRPASSRRRGGAQEPCRRAPPALPSWVDQPDARSLRQVTARIDGRTVDAHLVVEVGAGGAARGADGANRLTAAHALALAHVERGEMPVERVEVASVIDDVDCSRTRGQPSSATI